MSSLSPSSSYSFITHTRRKSRRPRPHLSALCAGFSPCFGAPPLVSHIPRCVYAFVELACAFVNFCFPEILLFTHLNTRSQSISFSVSSSFYLFLCPTFPLSLPCTTTKTQQVCLNVLWLVPRWVSLFKFVSDPAQIRHFLFPIYYRAYSRGIPVSGDNVRVMHDDVDVEKGQPALDTQSNSRYYIRTTFWGYSRIMLLQLHRPHTSTHKLNNEFVHMPHTYTHSTHTNNFFSCPLQCHSAYAARLRVCSRNTVLTVRCVVAVSSPRVSLL